LNIQPALRLVRSVAPGILLATALVLAAPAGAATHVVEIVATGFSPSHVELEIGDRVVWTNTTSVPHNVVADDGSFRSGATSHQFWSWGRFFSRGGPISYHSEGPGGLTGTLTVTGVFGDGFERATATGWDLVTPPELIRCGCYFSGDCNSGDFCNWGVLTAEDNCEWTLNKPNGVVGAGCDVLYTGVGWIGGICDGVCQPADVGSVPGAEDKTLIREAIGHWTASMLVPSSKPGGGPLDDGFAQKALDLPFRHPESALQIGRQVADLLMLSGVSEFYMYFCRWESYETGAEHPPAGINPDLSNQRCRAALAWQLADALAAEVDAPGSAAVVLGARPDICAGSGDTLGGHRCEGGNLDCLAQHVAGLAVYLTTPPEGDLLKKAFSRVKL
jgi:plastocyanin